MKNLFHRIRLILFPPVFSVEIKNRHASLEFGHADPAFIRECNLIAEDFSIDHGIILGLRSGSGKIRLEFGRIAGEHQQRIRNAWESLDRH